MVMRTRRNYLKTSWCSVLYSWNQLRRYISYVDGINGAGITFIQIENYVSFCHIFGPVEPVKTALLVEK